MTSRTDPEPEINAQKRSLCWVFISGKDGLILFAEILNTIPAKIAGIPITNRLIPKLLMPPCENKIACRDKPQAMAVIACVPSIIPTSPVNRRWVLVPKIPGTCRREPKKKTPASIAIFGMESSSVFASVKKSNQSEKGAQCTWHDCKRCCLHFGEQRFGCAHDRHGSRHKPVHTTRKPNCQRASCPT